MRSIIIAIGKVLKGGLASGLGRTRSRYLECGQEETTLNAPQKGMEKKLWRRDSETQRREGEVPSDLHSEFQNMKTGTTGKSNAQIYKDRDSYRTCKRLEFMVSRNWAGTIQRNPQDFLFRLWPVKSVGLVTSVLTREVGHMENQHLFLAPSGNGGCRENCHSKV